MFSQYIIHKGNIHAHTIFVPSYLLPKELPITTPITFPFLDNKVMMVLDKNGWWNPVAGKIELGESWEETLIREAQEEAGINITKIDVIGYIKATKLEDSPDNRYPDKSQLPITTSSILSINNNWVQKETLNRKLVSTTEAEDLLKKRNDNKQMHEIFKYIVKRT